jgi:hypothetical protein
MSFTRSMRSASAFHFILIKMLMTPRSIDEDEHSRHDGEPVNLTMCKWGRCILAVGGGVDVLPPK